MGDKNHGWVGLDKDGDLVIRHSFKLANLPPNSDLVPALKGSFRIVTIGEVEIVQKTNFELASTEADHELFTKDYKLTRVYNNNDEEWNATISVHLKFDEEPQIRTRIEVQTFGEDDKPINREFVSEIANVNRNVGILESRFTNDQGTPIKTELRWNSQVEDRYVALIRGYGIPTDSDDNTVMIDDEKSGVKKKYESIVDDYSFFVACADSTKPVIESDLPTLPEGQLDFNYGVTVTDPTVLYCPPYDENNLEDYKWSTMNTSVLNPDSDWKVQYKPGENEVFECGLYTVLKLVESVPQGV